jgi:hypothetical protein
MHCAMVIYIAASEVGFKIFLWWQVFFTDGTDQTYLAIAHLQGNQCEEHMDRMTIQQMKENVST